jgi:integrase
MLIFSTDAIRWVSSGRNFSYQFSVAQGCRHVLLGVALIAIALLALSSALFGFWCTFGETLRRGALAAGIKTEIGCHTFRATGITAYLKNGGKLEIAQQMAAHESARTTGLYDRRSDEVERIGI